jgi:hypothetical protein
MKSAISMIFGDSKSPIKGAIGKSNDLKPSQSHYQIPSYLPLNQGVKRVKSIHHKEKERTVKKRVFLGLDKKTDEQREEENRIKLEEELKLAIEREAKLKKEAELEVER